jgi:hypothetical protein
MDSATNTSKASDFSDKAGALNATAFSISLLKMASSFEAVCFYRKLPASASGKRRGRSRKQKLLLRSGLSFLKFSWLVIFLFWFFYLIATVITFIVPKFTCN